MGGKDLEMVDVDAQHAAEPSLQRLKTLDSLPDLKSQLKIANELCNHGHRAEMIVRWLTGKLQNDPKAAVNAEAWSLLEHCFRLVAPQKMGLLLARFDLFSAIKNAILELQGKKLLRLLESISKSIETLEEISSGSDGAVVKQLLGVDGASAAGLLGVWISRVSDLLSDESQLGSSDVIRLALPALRLWAGRRPNATDNDTFARDCLVPCSVLLKQLSHSPTSGSNKRRRGAQSGTTPDADASHELEILIARHVFLPSRSAILQAADKPESEQTMSELVTKLASIKSAIATAGASQDQLCGALPNLLDVALRCVPMTTSRQRSKERPWVEGVFQELLVCLDIDGKLVSPSALAGMLHVVGKRASLPASTLRELVQRYSGLANEKQVGLVDFALVAEVVALDATVFVDVATANQLFPALTGASAAAETSAEVADANALLSDKIARPVMRAFAGSRKLENFISRWQDQLETTKDPKSWTVWTQLDDELAELLEIHLTAEQIEQLFDTLRGAVVNSSGEKKKSSKSSSSKKGSTPQSQQAGVVVLHALLKGVKSDELVGRLQTRVGDLFNALLAIVQSSKVKTISAQVWHLLALTFKLWFPAWAVTQTDATLAAKKAKAILSDAAVESIMKAKDSGKIIDLGETFVGLLCSYLQGYEGCHELVSALAKRLAQSTTTNFSNVFLVFPDLLSLLEKNDRQSMTENITSSAMTSHSDKTDLLTVRRALAAFTNSAVTSPNTKLADEVIAAVLKSPDSDERVKLPVDREHAVLDLLLQVPATALARGQRERILNWITGLGYGSDVEEVRLTKRYAVMIRLMHLPNATANLCTDASTVWDLCRTSTNLKKSKCGKEKKSPETQLISNLDTLSMLDELSRLLCAYLLSTQDQDRSRTMLQALIEKAVENMRTIENLSDTSCERLVIINTIVEQTDSGAGKGVLSHLAGDASDSVVQFAERILEETQASVKALKKRGDTEQGDVVPKVLLELLASLRKSSIAGISLSKEDKALTKLCNKILANSSGSDGGISKAEHGTNKLLVPAFGLLAHIKGFEACTSLGEALLASSISSKDKQLLIGELKQLAKESKSSDQLVVLKQVIPNAHNASAQGIAVLQNALSVVSKDSIAKDEQGIHALYIQLLETLRQTKDFAAYTAAISCLLTIIRDRPFILNQHLTEATLQAIQSLARSSPAERLIYLDLCSILSALLLHHRARLQGRFHLLTATLQALQTRLFIPTKPTADSERRTLAPRHARAYTRLLTLLCNPPTRTHHSSSAAGKQNNLIDESRRARAHVGQFVPTLLHGFCAQILNGTLGEGVREALTPGLWAIVEAMEVQSPDAIKTLSAQMNNSERAVLRSVYDDWKRFGKWEGA